MNENESVSAIEKQKKYAFSRDIFLLGEDEEGTKYWLEAPSWDCGHYWGFGYIETYMRNNSPQSSGGISSHEHAENFYSKWWGNDDSRLKNTTFTEKEGWRIAELFKRFEILKKTAELFKTGGARVSGVDKYMKNEKLATEINKVLLPKVMNEICEILTPKK